MPIKDFINTVHNTDIIALLKQLPDKSVDCVYGDPDYNVGIKYNKKSYTINFDKYIEWYIELTRESIRVLKDEGNLFMINYPKQNSYLRVKYLDSVCYDVHDYSWVYNTNVGHSPRRFTTAHRSILHARKIKDNKFYKDNVSLPYKNLSDKRILQKMADGSAGRMPYSWFYFDLVKNVSKEKTFHACQIPQDLSSMLIKSCTMPGDTVVVLFGGSGSELDICRGNDRNYISAELDKKYYEIILDRLKSGVIDKKYMLKSNKKRASSPPKKEFSDDLFPHLKKIIRQK
jgi:site-specific DNA-methyltransferase (adenine-specific)